MKFTFISIHDIQTQYSNKKIKEPTSVRMLIFTIARKVVVKSDMR